MPRAHQNELKEFTAQRSFRGKGPLSVALVVTQHARTMGLPLLPEKLLTEGGGQVLGLGKGAVQSVLKRYGIDRVLASEGGRTSRGSLGHMREYAAFLNELSRKGKVDLDAIEGFWIECVHEFFAGKPFRIKLDGSRSLRMIVRDVIAQAVERQKTAPGVYYAGAVLQHLVGAKLDCVLGAGKFEHNSFSTADAPGGAVIEKCRDNLNDGYRPLLVTLQHGLTVAEGLAANVDLGDRIDIFEIEQFVALNLYELAEFGSEGRKTAVTDLINRYNEIVEEFETDPSLKIELRR